jgi:DNA-binding response OmpR family regulator
MEKKPYIVIAEDDPFYGSILRTKLSKEGFEVLVTKNGEEAMAALRARCPQFLITNLIMPVKDGFTLLKEVREDKDLKNLKALVLSNLGEEEDKKKVLAMGLVEYVVKVNIALADIIQKIKQSAS